MKNGDRKRTGDWEQEPANIHLISSDWEYMDINRIYLCPTIV